MPETIRVSDEASRNLFFRVPDFLYESERDWVAARREEIEPYLAMGAQWIHRDGDRALGRIAAWPVGLKAERAVGTFGFLDAPDDPQITAALLDAASAWLAEHGLFGMDGPANPVERDRFAGALTWGFGRPLVLENYNGPWLGAHLIAAGFRPLFEAITYALQVSDSIPSPSIAHVHFSHYEPRESRAFAEAVHHVYKTAFRDGTRPSRLRTEDIEAMLAGGTEQIDPRLLMLASVHGEPAAVLAAIPDRNDRDPRTSAKIFLFAIHPDHQWTELPLAFVGHAARVMRSAGYRKTYLAGIGGHTRGLHALLDRLDARVHRVHVTFRRFFDGAPIAPLAMPIPTGLEGYGWNPSR